MRKGSIFFCKYDIFLLLLHKIYIKNAEVFINRQWK